MKTLTLSFATAALTLAACAPVTVSPPYSSAGVIDPQLAVYQTGFGTITGEFSAPSPMTAASGGTGSGGLLQPQTGTSSTDRLEAPFPTPSNSANRITRLAVRMDNGATQYVDTDSTEFKKGMRVQLTPDHIIQKVQ
jgi:hypothetical protein